MKDRQGRFRYSVGILASACFLAVINFFHFSRPATCADCYFPYGVPFTIYHAGGFAGDTGFVWAGMAGDLFLMVAIGIAIGWTWKKFSEMRSSKV